MQAQDLDRVAGVLASSRVTRRIARAMLGRAVTLNGPGEIVHGIVTSVIAEGDKLRVVVGGAEYSLAQILTVAPPDLADIRTQA